LPSYAGPPAQGVIDRDQGALNIPEVDLVSHDLGKMIAYAFGHVNHAHTGRAIRP
jgi:hypothetical protein